MAITREQVEHIARLARLELEPAELDRAARELGSILEYIEQLQALDTRDIEPTAHVLDLVMVSRPDQVHPSLPAEQVLEAAPESGEGHFRVPRILG
ncbi:MAG TPA: Asp-tRNA(Asn)/Glu-tRNA(Gln) amidotransferase subunit GatC [Acidobacteriota bacterium]